MTGWHGAKGEVKGVAGRPEEDNIVESGNVRTVDHSLSATVQM